jgi:hypothetical protein
MYYILRHLHINNDKHNLIMEKQNILIDVDKFKEILLHSWNLLPAEKQIELREMGVYSKLTVTARCRSATNQRPKIERFIYLHIFYIFTHRRCFYMVTMTLAVPSDLKSRMDTFPELNWSEVARQAFKQKINDLEILNSFAKASKLTKKDAQILGDKVSRSLAKRY